MQIVALIPARAGSKRIPGKNTKLLGGKPLIQWTIEAAKEVGFFSGIAVCTDDPAAAEIARSSDVAMVPRERAGDSEPDIEWVRQALLRIKCDAFAILRPTSPFRTARSINRAWGLLLDFPADSLRAVERVKEHPGKMWMKRGGKLIPLLPYEQNGTPWHSTPTQALPEVWKQNASLEMAWVKTVERTGTIAGTDIIAFNTEGMEGFDINTPEDWAVAEAHARTLLAPVS